MNWMLIDIGSVQTKVTLLEKNEIWNILKTVKTKTTIESEDKNAYVGVKRAIEEILKECQLNIEDINKVVVGSTAGGGLQMAVAGVVRNMTAESAWRAALGSGALVIDIISGGSPVKQPERLNQFKSIKPDIILLAGGTEGGNVKQVLGLAETINAANTKTRWGDEYASVVFAGNSEVREEVKSFLSNKIDLKIAENIRPELELEKIDTVNETIQNLYMDKVAKNVSGFSNISEAYNTEIKPIAPNMRYLVNQYSEFKGINTIIIDVGGFTTDIYSSIEYIRRAYKRSVEDGGEHINTGVGVVKERKSYTSIAADAGLNYSAPRLVNKIGVSSILKWTSGLNEKEILNSVFTRMVNPLSEDIYSDKLNKALFASALKVGFLEHQQIASKLHGVGIVRSMNETFAQEAVSEGTIAEWEAFDRAILTGGVIGSFSEKEVIQIFNDSLQPLGLINVKLDKNDFWSQLALKENWEESDLDYIDSQLTSLVNIIAPKKIEALLIRNIATVTLQSKYETKTCDVIKNEIEFIKIKGDTIKVTIKPHKKVDFGFGIGKPITKDIENASYGFILDGRRPINDEFNEIKVNDWYGKGLSRLERGEHNE